MSSKYNPATTPRNSPPWCRPGMFTLAPPEDGQLPPMAVVNAYWFDTTTVPIAKSAEFIRVAWVAALNGWRGDSRGPGYTLRVEIVKTAVPNVYDLALFLFYNGAAIDDESWHDVPVQPFPNFDSGPQDHIYNWPDDANGMWIRV